MATFEESTARAGQIQQPPPEEAVELPVVVDRVSALAKRLRDAQYRQRAQQDICYKNEDRNLVYTGPRPNKVSMKQWQGVAKKLVAANVTNAERFIFSQGTSGYARFANQLGNAASLLKFDIYDKQAERFLTQDWKSQALVFESGAMDVAQSYPNWPTRRTWDFALRSSTLELSPLFRYCIAVSERLYETAALFRDEALYQLLTDPIGYGSVWRDYISQKLLDEASAIIATPL